MLRKEYTMTKRGRVQWWFSIRKSHNIDRSKEKNHIFIFIDSEKGFDKILPIFVMLLCRSRFPYLYYFPYAWKTFLNIFCVVSLLVVISLRFYVWKCLCFEKVCFQGIEFHVDRFFSFSILKMFLHHLLACIFPLRNFVTFLFLFLYK